MATIHQSLLETPKTKFSHCKALYVLLSLIAIIGLIALVSLGLFNFSSTYPPLKAHICNQAHDPPSCIATVSKLASDESMEMKGADLLRFLLQKSTFTIEETIEMAKEINGQKEQGALADCLELMDMSKDRIVGSMMSLDNLTAHSHFEAYTWLRSVLTNYVTCLDGLNGPARSIMEPRLKELILEAKTSLAMVVAISSPPVTADVLRPLN